MKKIHRYPGVPTPIELGNQMTAKVIAENKVRSSEENVFLDTYGRFNPADHGPKPPMPLPAEEGPGIYSSIFEFLSPMTNWIGSFFS